MPKSRKMMYLEEIDRIADERRQRAIKDRLTSFAFIVLTVYFIVHYLFFRTLF